MALADLLTENLALRRLLTPPHGSASAEQVGALLDEAKDHPEVRERVAELLKPLRRRLESRSNLEAALKDFVQRLPLTKNVELALAPIVRSLHSIGRNYRLLLVLSGDNS
jgi:hypothetical protein